MLHVLAIGRRTGHESESVRIRWNVFDRIPSIAQFGSVQSGESYRLGDSSNWHDLFQTKHDELSVIGTVFVVDAAALGAVDIVDRVEDQIPQFEYGSDNPENVEYILARESHRLQSFLHLRNPIHRAKPNRVNRSSREIRHRPPVSSTNRQIRETPKARVKEKQKTNGTEQMLPHYAHMLI